MLTVEEFAQVSEWYNDKLSKIMQAPGYGINKYSIPWLNSLCAAHKMLFEECSSEGLVMYPWFPVGPHFVELGNPRTKVGIVFGQDEATRARVDAMQTIHGWSIYPVEVPCTDGFDRTTLMNALETCGAFDLLETIRERHGNHATPTRV